MKFTEIKNLQPEDLKERLMVARKELAEARLKNRVGRLENTMLIRSLRRDIARLLTALNKKG